MCAAMNADNEALIKELGLDLCNYYNSKTDRYYDYNNTPLDITVGGELIETRHNAVIKLTIKH